MTGDECDSDEGGSVMSDTPDWLICVKIELSHATFRDSFELFKSETIKSANLVMDDI